MCPCDWSSDVCSSDLYGDHRDLHSFPTRRSSDLQNRNRTCTRSSKSAAHTLTSIKMHSASSQHSDLNNINIIPRNTQQPSIKIKGTLAILCSCFSQDSQQKDLSMSSRVDQACLGITPHKPSQLTFMQFITTTHQLCGSATFHKWVFDLHPVCLKVAGPC